MKFDRHRKLHLVMMCCIVKSSSSSSLDTARHDNNLQLIIAFEWPFDNGQWNVEATIQTWNLVVACVPRIAIEMQPVATSAVVVWSNWQNIIVNR